ncbi:MAG TPA: MMPL family transporter [Acidiferrobacterales bacterium]
MVGKRREEGSAASATTRSAAWARFVLRHRVAVAVFSLIVAAAAGAGIGRLEFDANYQAFFSEANPHLTAYESLQKVYSKNDSILIVLAPRSGDVFDTSVLSAVTELTAAGWQVPHSRRVDSLTNFQYSHASRDDLVVRDLVPDAAALDAAARAELRRIALAEPLLVNRLVSPRGDVTGVNVTIRLSGDDAGEVEEAVRHVEALIADLRARHPQIDVYLTGGVMLDHAFRDASLRDMRTLVPVVYAAIVLIMAALLRSWSGTAVTLLVIALASATGMGLAGWLGIGLTPPSVGAATIIMTLAVADSIHILITVRKEMARGRGRDAALIESLRVNMQPVFLTSLTTAIGFLSMNYSDAPPFRDLGNITAMGVAAAWVYSIALLPALMAMLPLRAPRAAAAGRAPAMAALAGFVIRRRRALLAAMTVGVVLLGSGIARIELDDQFVEYFDRSVRFRTDTDYVMRHLTGIYQLEYSLPAESAHGIGDPDYLRRLEAFADWFARQPETVHVNTLVPILKRLNRNLHGDDPAWHRLPDSRALAAQYLLLFEMSLPYGLDLNDQVNLDKSATRMVVTLRNITTAGMRALETRAADWQRDHLPPAMVTPASSAAVMFTYISERNIRTMLVGSLLAVLLICITLIVALRSLKLGLISLIPNVVPAVMAFGLWGYLVGRVGLVVSVVFAMALGIIVDDTVHFLSKYLRARRERRLTPAGAVRYAYETVGTALWVTSAILIVGFALLSFSSFALNAATGQLTAVTIGFALVADFLLLPPLLMWLDRGR